MKTTIELVREFQTRAKQQIMISPDVSNHDVNLFRGKLILEELGEYFSAIGYAAVGSNLCELSRTLKTDHRKGYPDLIMTFDALLDLQYVLDGTFIQQGFILYKQAGFEEVHRSNMTKDFPANTAENVPYKITKGPNYQSPQLKKVLGLQS